MSALFITIMVQMFMRDLRRVPALWSVRFRVSALERFCYKIFIRNSSGTKFFVRLREVSALEDVRFREVPLYHNSNIGDKEKTNLSDSISDRLSNAASLEGNRCKANFVSPNEVFLSKALLKMKLTSVKKSPSVNFAPKHFNKALRKLKQKL